MVGVAAWLAVAAIVGVLIGLTVRQREKQVPREDHDSLFLDTLNDDQRRAGGTVAHRRRPSVS
jgi:hypothetical protein